MKVMSAREAKNHFGEFLDASRREPVIVTKNNRPVGILISIEDAADTLIQELIMEKEPGYDEWLFGKITATKERVESGESVLREHADAMASLKARLDVRLARKTA
jgi:prevent-host-death family protein